MDSGSQETPASKDVEAVQSLESTSLQRDPWLHKDAVDSEVRVATVRHIVLLTSDSAVPDLSVELRGYVVHRMI